MKTLGEMTEDEQNALLRAKYIEGKVIEFKPLLGDRWAECDKPTWNPDCCYRVKLEPASIDWDHVRDDLIELNFSRGWRLESQGGVKSIPANVFSSFKPGDVDTVVYRPGNGACQATVIG